MPDMMIMTYCFGHKCPTYLCRVLKGSLKMRLQKKRMFHMKHSPFLFAYIQQNLVFVVFPNFIRIRHRLTRFGFHQIIGIHRFDFVAQQKQRNHVRNHH